MSATNTIAPPLLYNTEIQKYKHTNTHALCHCFLKLWLCTNNFFLILQKCAVSNILQIHCTIAEFWRRLMRCQVTLWILLSHFQFHNFKSTPSLSVIITISINGHHHHELFISLVIAQTSKRWVKLFLIIIANSVHVHTSQNSSSIDLYSHVCVCPSPSVTFFFSLFSL